MAGLTLAKWARYEPSIPGNADLPAGERFYLELHAGMSTVAFGALLEALKDAKDAAAVAAALSPSVRLGAVPLTLDGESVDTLEKYVAAISEQRGSPLLFELQERLVWFNSYGGTRELFCVRPFGGTASTAGAQKTDAA
jgi:hypothetical protein